MGADVTTLGTVAGTELVGTFNDYKAWTIEAGYRHYFAKRRERIRPYAGGTFGVAIIAEIDGAFAAPDLVIPHPLFRTRAFVLDPAVRIAASWRDPVTGFTVRQLHARLTRPAAGHR